MSVKIGPHEFQIVETPDLKAGDDELYGLCDFSAGVIHTTAGLRPMLKAETQMHEILHAMSMESGVLSDTDEQEAAVSALASHLTMFAQQNPAWLHEWIDRCKK